MCPIRHFAIRAGSLLRSRGEHEALLAAMPTIKAHLSEQDGTGHIRVPINVSLGRAGKLKLGGLYIQMYKLEAPTGLQARPLAEGNAVRLSWDDHTGKSDDISKMAIEFWNGTGWEELTKVPRLNTSHVIRGLTDGMEYQFRLRAFDGDVSVYSEPSAEVRATPNDTKAPERVIDVVATEIREVMGINLSWGASDPDTVNYEVWSNKSGEWEVLTNVSAPETKFFHVYWTALFVMQENGGSVQTPFLSSCFSKFAQHHVANTGFDPVCPDFP